MLLFGLIFGTSYNYQYVKPIYAQYVFIVWIIRQQTRNRAFHWWLDEYCFLPHSKRIMTEIHDLSWPYGTLPAKRTFKPVHHTQFGGKRKRKVHRWNNRCDILGSKGAVNGCIFARTPIKSLLMRPTKTLHLYIQTFIWYLLLFNLNW